MKGRGNSPTLLSKKWPWIVVIVLLVIIFLWRFLKGKLSALSGRSSSGFVVTEDTSVHGINNPGNILYSSANNWQGQTGYNIRVINGKQYCYVNFDTMENGERALRRLIQVHALRNGFSDEALRSKPDDVVGVGSIYASYSGNPSVRENFERLHTQLVEQYNYPTLLDSLATAIVQFEGN